MGGQLSSATDPPRYYEIPSSSTMKKQEKGERDKGGTTTANTKAAAAPPPPSSKTTKSKTASTTTATAKVATTTTAAAVTATTKASAAASGANTTSSTASKTCAPSTPVMGMKQSKSDHSGLAGRGAGGKSSASSSAASKKYMSKSQENLSSGASKKKQLSTVKEVDPSRAGASGNGSGPRPASTTSAGSSTSSSKATGVSTGVKSSQQASSSKSTCVSALEKNKENQVLKEKEKNSMFVKPKAVKAQAGGSSMRKASSTQSIDMGSNTTGSVRSVNSNKSSASQNSMKRAQSTQNVSKDKLLKKRTSTSADVMAYNAELLANFEKEKKVLEERISELTKVAENRKADIEKYKYEIKHLKGTIAVAHNIHTQEELEQLQHQNRHLMDRLKELNIPVEQFTDTEKLIMKSSGSVKSLGKSGDSVSASDCHLHPSVSCDSLSIDGAKGLPPGSGGMDVRVNVTKLGTLQRSSSMSASEPGMSLTDLCGTPEHASILSSLMGMEGPGSSNNWDKQSNKSCGSDALSEISVACLTERILQMEETNYSTTEELQATLQELGDLQDAVNELTEENGRLADEKAVLLESLCTQTEKLETTRTQVEQLKSLLISGSLPDKSGREEHLLELLKSAQEEREELFRKQTEWSNALRSMEADCKEYQDMLEGLRDKLQVVEERCQMVKMERDAQERQVAELKENVSADQIELACLKTLLDSEKSKVAELEKCQQAENQSELEALLDQTRQDKARGEQRLASLQESLAHSQNEVTRLRESLATREEELKVSWNSAKTEVSDLQYRMEKSDKERSDAVQEVETLREHIDQLQQDCDTYLDEKKTYCTKVQELTADLHNLRMQKSKVESDFTELMSRHESEAEEWQQFQKDLQVAVVIANDFRAETQESMQKVSEENMALREKSLNLQLELDRMKNELQAVRAARSFDESRAAAGANRATILSNAELKGKELLKSPASPPTPTSPSSPTKDFRNAVSSSEKTSSDSKMSLQNRLSGSGLSPVSETPSASKAARAESETAASSSGAKVNPQISSILKDRGNSRRNSQICEMERSKDSSGKDPLSFLAKQMGGSKRNALLKWCQQKTLSYNCVDITNFSSSWNDGLAFCALMHNYLPEKIPYNTLSTEDKRKNFTLAFTAAESVGILSSLNLNDMVAMERPDWQAVMTYVTSIYKHFEIDARQPSGSSPSPSS